MSLAQFIAPGVVDFQGKYDFRSDTVTKPSVEMLSFMLQSPLGDDVFQEDPSVIKLQEEVAKLTGKEAALFCCTGVMANQLCIKTLVEMSPSSYFLKEVICDLRSHVYAWESGGIAYHSHAQPKPIKNEIGYLTAQLIAPYLSVATSVPEAHHQPRTALICLENTIGGTVVPLPVIEEIHQLAKKNGIFMHLDGARLWNASAETGISVAEYSKHFDSISLCFSKGLGAPVGSVIAGSAEFIKRARFYRKLFGGGWRQAGLLASCCLYALNFNFPNKLKIDHENAATLRKGLESLGFKVGGATNISWIDTSPLGFTTEEWATELGKEGLIIRPGGFSCRLATHLQITAEAIQKLLSVTKTFISSRSAK